MTLYALSLIGRRLLDLAEANKGEISQQDLAKWDQLDQNLSVKADSCGRVIAQLEAGAEAAQTEGRRLIGLANQRNAAIQKLKDHFLNCMILAGITKIDSTFFPMRIQKNSRPSIKWMKNLDDLPVEYLKISYDLDGTAAQEAYKQTGNLPDGFAVNWGQHLRIG